MREVKRCSTISIRVMATMTSARSTCHGSNWAEVRARTEKEEDARDRADDIRDRDRDVRDRDHDPRDAFLRDLELPRGPEREVVVDGDHRYELNGDDRSPRAAAT